MHYYHQKSECIPPLWDNTPPMTKEQAENLAIVQKNILMCLLVYLAISVLCNIHYCYSDAKIALKKHREKPNKDYSEFEVVRLSINYGQNFCDSLVFPWTFCKNIIPCLVIFMNPDKNPK